MSTIKAIIVEDEKEGLTNLVLKLEKHCPYVEIIAKCTDGKSAIEAIKSQKPQLVFLDINLGVLSGFDVLNEVRNIHFEVIFTTSYNRYAVRAFKENAIDYLQKPIDVDELKAAVVKAREKIQTYGLIKRIIVPINRGFKILPVEDIIYCLAHDNLTKIFLKDQSRPLVISRTLKDTTEKLPLDMFMRIHRKATINLYYVDFYKTEKGGYVTMQNSDDLGVANDKKSELLARLGAI